MNGIFPLRQFPVRERAFMYGLVSIFGVVWIVMMFASTNMARGVSSGISRVLVAGFLLVAAIGATEMRALARAGEVIGAQQMPAALWRKWVRACIVETSLLWAFVGVGMALLLASRGSSMPWPAAIALLSSGLCVGATCMLAQYSMAPKNLGWLANVVAAAMLLAALYFGPPRALAWFVDLPLPLLAMLALSWPLLAVVLALEWRRTPVAGSALPSASGRKWLASLSKRIQRYAPLDAAWARQSHAQQSTARSRLNWAGKNAFYWFLFYGMLVPLRWDQQPDLRHLVSLALLCLIMSNTLVARDLHWRWLLTPGGRAGSIVSRIFVPTVGIYLLALAGVLLTKMLWVRLVLGTEVQPLIEPVVSHVPVLAAIGFAVSAGLVIRAIPRRLAVETFTGLLFVGLWVYARAVGHATLWKAPAAGGFYTVTLVACTCILLLVAKRMWTKEKLLACARGGA
ncbi:MAG: hypothetical protein V4693_01900 [Pseudomonadota bacterium]